MNPKQLLNARIDEQGRLVLPPELVQKYNLTPGTQIHIEDSLQEFHVLRPINQLAKVYIEITNACNLDCVTCMRNVWDEPLGRMNAATFERILEVIATLTPRPTVFFGGYGEPLTHPKVAEWIGQVKALGANAELITNGILLNEEKSLSLIRAGLDMLWVSLDGASPESYADVRLGASFPQVIENLRRLRTVRYKAGYQHEPKPQLGIAFVAMKSNIADLPEVLRLGSILGAKRFSVSNVLAHTAELQEEVLYRRALDQHAVWKDTNQAIVNLPRIDINSVTQVPVSEIHSRKYVLQLAGKPVNRSIDTCQFIEQGSTAVRWDGMVSPCLPLLHTNEGYLERYPRRSLAYGVGNVNERSLLEIWNDPEYVALRERVRVFDFSPCTGCTGCELSTENQDDCMASPFPTCGGCLWGQGLIQCP